MKNLIAFSSVCLAGLLISSCATTGAIADNDVYLQQPTASVLQEDETDPTSFANFKAQEREEIVVTRDVMTPFTMNLITTNYYSPFTPIPFGYNAFPYYTMYHNHMMFEHYNGFYNGLYIGHNWGFGYAQYGYYSPYQWGYNPYHNFYMNNYYGYGQYSNGFGFSGNNQASHNTNHFYQHRSSATVGAPRNSNYPSTLKSTTVQTANTVNRPYSVNRTPATQPANKTVRRNIGSSYQVGNGNSRNTNSGTSSANSSRPSYAANSPSKRPAQTFSTPQSSPSASKPRSTQTISGTSRRGSTTNSGRSTTLRTPTNGNSGTVSTPRRTSSTPSTYSGGGSSRSSGTSGSSGGSSRRSSSGGSSSSTSGRR